MKVDLDEKDVDVYEEGSSGRLQGSGRRVVICREGAVVSINGCMRVK